MRARVKTAEEITGVKGIKSFDLAGGIIYSYAFNRLREIEVEELGKDNIYNFHDEIGHCFLKDWLEFLPEPDLEMDAKVVVWDNCSGKKRNRHFCGRFSEDGNNKIGCWDEGKTSWSTCDNHIVYWSNWRKVEADADEKA